MTAAAIFAAYAFIRFRRHCCYYAMPLSFLCLFPPLRRFRHFRFTTPGHCRHYAAFAFIFAVIIAFASFLSPLLMPPLPFRRFHMPLR